jgi:hypothetical protein
MGRDISAPERHLGQITAFAVFCAILITALAGATVWLIWTVAGVWAGMIAAGIVAAIGIGLMRQDQTPAPRQAEMAGIRSNWQIVKQIVQHIIGGTGLVLRGQFGGIHVSIFIGPCGSLWMHFGMHTGCLVGLWINTHRSPSLGHVRTAMVRQSLQWRHAEGRGA